MREKMSLGRTGYSRYDQPIFSLPMKSFVSFCLLLLLFGGCQFHTPPTKTEHPPVVSTEKEKTPLQEEEEYHQLISTRISEIRGLTYKTPVPFQKFSQEELETYLETVLEKEYPKAVRDRDYHLLSGLGFIPPEFNIEEFLFSFYSQGIEGLYDTDTKTFYTMDHFTTKSYESLIIAHELLHALEDQWFSLDTWSDRFVEEKADDRLLAYTALVEGSAMHLMNTYNSTYTEDTAGLLLGALGSSFKLMGMEKAPAYFDHVMTFTYMDGEAFVAHHVKNEGWEKINAMYKNPPESTEQILHPDRYSTDLPKTVSTPTLPTSWGQWKKSEDTTLGELQIKLFLQEKLGEPLATRAAEGWGGDKTTFYTQTSRELGKTTPEVFTMYILWDSEEEAQEFYTIWQESQLGKETKHGYIYEHKGRAGRVERKGNATLLIETQDPTIKGTLEERPPIL